MAVNNEHEYPSPAYAWYVVVILFFAYVISFLDRQIMSLLIEPIKQDLHLSDTMISLMIGFAFAIFYTIVGIPLGRLADSRNRKGIIIVGVSVWSLMTSLCGLAQNALVLFLARIGVGVGEASLSPSAYSIISDYFPKDKRGRAASLYSLGIFAGAGMAFMFGGLISGYAARAAESYAFLAGFRPWQITFLLTGSLGVFVVLLMLTVTEPERRERLQSGAGSIPLREVAHYIKQHWQVYGALITGTAFISVGPYCLFVWTPAFFIRVHDYTQREIGVTFGAIVLVLGTASLILGSYLADRWFHKGHKGAHLDITIVMTGIAIIPMIFLLLTSDNQTSALTFIACTILFLTVHTGLAPAALQLITPNELRGQVIALYLFILNLIGLGCGPTAVALLTDRYFKDPMAVGHSMAITIIAALSIGVMLLIWGRRSYVKKQNDL